MLDKPLGARQIAYKVDKLEEAALAHHRMHGSGPFFVANKIKLSSSQHRGTEQPFVHSSAYGQWGSLMVELVVQHNDAPSAVHDMFPYGTIGTGLHHVALFVDDLAKAIGHFGALGAPLAQLSVTEAGSAFAFVDATPTLGHMIELYEPTPQLTGFYAMVAKAAEGWDGKDPVRDMG